MFCKLTGTRHLAIFSLQLKRENDYFLYVQKSNVNVIKKIFLSSTDASPFCFLYCFVYLVDKVDKNRVKYHRFLYKVLVRMGLLVYYLGALLDLGEIFLTDVSQEHRVKTIYTRNIIMIDDLKIKFITLNKFLDLGIFI